MPDFEICIKVIGKKVVRVTADDKDKAYALVNAQALEHVTPSRAPANPVDFFWQGVMSLFSPEWQCQCGRVLDHECDRCARCGHVAADGADFIHDYEAETFECPECGHVNDPARGDCSACPDCGTDSNEAMSFNPGDRRITYPTEESLRAVADAADVVMHHFADSHWQESSFAKMVDAMEPLRLALLAAGYGRPKSWRPS